MPHRIDAIHLKQGFQYPQFLMGHKVMAMPERPILPVLPVLCV